MIGLAIRFDLGRFHATPWETHVNDAAVEWPPSAWRILRGLYAVARTDVRLGESVDAIDAAISALAVAAPPTYRLPPSSPVHTRHYMPSRAFSSARPGKETDRVLDGFLVLDPEDELQVWWEAELDDSGCKALALAAAALGYVGRSESVCTARVLLNGPCDSPDAAPLDSGREGEWDTETRLMCVEHADPLGALRVSVSELRGDRLLQPRGTRWVDYGVRLPNRPQGSSRSTNLPTLALYRLRGGSRPGIREALSVTDSLRAALQARYGRANEGRTSTVFSGRSAGAPRRDQHGHAHFLALPGTDGPRVDHLAVWAPEGFGEGEIQALAGLRSIRTRETPDGLRVALAALGQTEKMRHARLLGPSRGWETLTPFGLTRHPKRRRGVAVDGPADQVKRELSLRGMPAPQTVDLIPGPWLEFRRSRPRASRLGAPRAVGVRLTFEEEVSGPLALGALSHFGLGLFVPAG